MKIYETRAYQEQATADITAAFRQHRRVVYVAPTGSGKTFLFNRAAKRAAERGRRAVILVHRQELLDQTDAALSDMGVGHGIIAAGWPHSPQFAVQVASVQTLARRLGRWPAFDLVVVDECHHARAGQYEKILAAWPQSYVLGVSASPARLDGRGLGAAFEALIPGPSVKSLISQGYLSDYRLFAPPPADISQARTLAGEFNAADIAEAVDQPKIVGDVVDHWLRIAPGTQTICFAVNIRHSEHIVEAFRAAGVAAVHLDGDADTDDRRRIMREFADRRWQVVSNVSLFGEGLDIPGIETVIVARHTKSLTIWLQAVGRALRPAPGKIATIIDHGGNNDRLGSPDADRVWSLDDRPKRQAAKTEVPTKTCPVCFLVVPAAAGRCHCGHEFAADTEIPEHGDADLIDRGRGGTADEVAAEFARRHDEQNRRRAEEWACKSLAELTELAKRRGYKTGWAYYRWKIQSAKRPQKQAGLL